MDQIAGPSRLGPWQLSLLSDDAPIDFEYARTLPSPASHPDSSSYLSQSGAADTQSRRLSSTSTRRRRTLRRRQDDLDTAMTADVAHLSSSSSSSSSRRNPFHPSLPLPPSPSLSAEAEEQRRDDPPPLSSSSCSTFPSSSFSSTNSRRSRSSRSSSRPSSRSSSPRSSSTHDRARLYTPNPLCIASSVLIINQALFRGAAAAPAPAPASSSTEAKGKARALDLEEVAGSSTSRRDRRDGVIHEDVASMVKVRTSHPLPRADAALPEHLRLAPSPSLASPPPPPSRASKRDLTSSAAAAYSSGIIADWTHQSRSVWFQRKAIIIVSCFLAIFIVLIIGAAVFLRDRREEGEEDEDDLSDEAALKRMREERKMRSGGRKKKVQKEVDSAGASPSIGANGGSPGRRTNRRNLGDGERGSSSGSSTAISKRLVSRWIRAPGGLSSDGNRRHQGSSDSSSAANDSASIRSNRSQASRRSRLGPPRQERVEVEYHGDQSQSLQTTSSRTDERRSTTISATPSPASNGNRSLPALDAADIQAAEAAESGQANLPPAYIPASGSASHDQAGDAGVGASTSSGPRYVRPLAGEEVSVGDVKGARRTTSPPVADMSGLPLGAADALGQDDAADDSQVDSGTAHIATDDKARLAALAAAASGPNASAPRYSAAGDDDDPADSAGASAPETPYVDDAAAGPSAPPLLLEDEEFERLPDEDGIGASASSYGPSGSSHQRVAGSSSGVERPHDDLAPGYSGNVRTVEKGKGKGLLPNPPKPHLQAFSPFDRPYQAPYPPTSSAGDVRSVSSQAALLGAPRSPVVSTAGSEDDRASVLSSAAPSTPAVDAERLARRAEKQREAEAELALAASSPADFSSREPGAPGSLAGFASSAGGSEALPAYSRGQTSVPVAAATATAPPVDDLFDGTHDGVPGHEGNNVGSVVHDEADAGSSPLASAPGAPSAPSSTPAAPSAPPLDD